MTETMTFYNVMVPHAVGDIIPLYEQGQRWLYLITAVVMVGDTVTYWVRLV